MNVIALTLSELSSCCLSNEISIGVAESVTAGYLQFLLSQMPNATQVFNGGITTYNIGQKVKHLGLDYTYGIKCNCVSQPTAEIMALHIGDLFNSKMGVAITGYASPVPEEGINELHAYMAIAFKGHIVRRYKLLTKATSPAEAQKDYAQQVITEMLACMSTLPVKS